MHGLNGLVYYFLYPGHPLFVRIRPKSQLLSTPSPRFFSFQSFERILVNSAHLPPLFLFLFRPQCISNEKCSSQLAHPSILCVPGFPGIFTLVSFKRLIVNSRVRRIASDETYGCLKASFEEIKIEYHTYAGIGTTNGKEAKTRNEKARESNARATIFQIVRHSLRITRGKNFPRNYIFLLHYRLSIIEMHTRCFARLIHWSVELCVVAVEPRAAECRKLARKLPS